MSWTRQSSPRKNGRKSVFRVFRTDYHRCEFIKSFPSEDAAKALVKPTKSKVCEWDGSFDGLEKYMIQQKPKFDKATARKDMMAGVEIPHCTLVEKTSVSIK